MIAAFAIHQLVLLIRNLECWVCLDILFLAYNTLSLASIFGFLYPQERWVGTRMQEAQKTKYLEIKVLHTPLQRDTDVPMNKHAHRHMPVAFLH